MGFLAAQLHSENGDLGSQSHTAPGCRSTARPGAGAACAPGAICFSGVSAHYLPPHSTEMDLKALGDLAD